MIPCTEIGLHQLILNMYKYRETILGQSSDKIRTLSSPRYYTSIKGTSSPYNLIYQVLKGKFFKSIPDKSKSMVVFLLECEN
jgi:hypothetical protein